MKAVTEQMSPGRKMIDHLYELYHLKDGKPAPYSYGDPIHISFSLRAIASGSEIKLASEFADGLRKVISTNEASIVCRSSRVIVTPLI